MLIYCSDVMLFLFPFLYCTDYNNNMFASQYVVRGMQIFEVGQTSRTLWRSKRSISVSLDTHNAGDWNAITWIMQGSHLVTWESLLNPDILVSSCVRSQVVLGEITLSVVNNLFSSIQLRPFIATSMMIVDTLKSSKSVHLKRCSPSLVQKVSTNITSSAPPWMSSLFSPV